MPPLSEIKALANSPEALRSKFEPHVIIQTDKIAVIAGKGNLELSEKIAFLLGTKLDEPVDVFPDGEAKIQGIKQNLRKKEVFLIQSMHPYPNDRIVELFLMVDAARRASADDIAAVMLYPPYMRQDHKDQSRTPISASLMPEILEKIGVNRLLTMDLHADSQQGYFRGPWDTVPASRVLVDEILKRKLPNPAIAAADTGGLKRARKFSQILELGDSVIQGDKERPPEQLGKSKSHGYNGEVRGKDIILVEDIIDTGGTILDIANKMHKNGARSIRVVAAYGLFSRKKRRRSAIQLINKSPIDEVMVTDAIKPKESALESEKITYVSIAPMIAEAMLCVYTGESISQRLILDPPKS